MNVAISERARVDVDGKLPAVVEPVWYPAGTKEAVAAVAPGVEVGWLDILSPTAMAAALGNGPDLKWVATAQAGISHLPLATFKERGVTLTNGAGVNAIPG